MAKRWTGVSCLAFGAFGVAALACSAEATTPPPSPTPQPSASPTGTTDPPKNEPAPEARKSGEVRLLTYFGGEALVRAKFMADPKALPPGCTSQKSGSCELLDCESPAAARAGLVGAGQVEVYGGTPSVSITVDPQSNVYAATKPAPVGKSFVPATRVVVRATGGEVPAFDGTVDFPTLAKMTGPALGAKVGRGADLALEWTGGAAGAVMEVELSGRTAERALKVTCQYPAEAGTGKLPTALLAKLPAGNAEIASFTYGKGSVAAGPFDVATLAGSESLTQAGDAPWAGRLTLE